MNKIENIFFIIDNYTKYLKMTSIAKKIEKKIQKTYDDIMKLILEDVSKKYNISKEELKKKLEEEKD